MSEKLTYAQIAEAYGVSASAVRHYRSTDSAFPYPCSRRGRRLEFDAAEVTAWFSNRDGKRKTGRLSRQTDQRYKTTPEEREEIREFMRSQDIGVLHLSQAVGCSYELMRTKLNGRTGWTTEEILTLQPILGETRAWHALKKAAEVSE